ncbi:MAG: hypothetical protein RL078_835 [Bacteroidota bacterium]
MINNLGSYFAAEKQESVIFISVGILAIAVSIWLWINGHRLKSMAYPLVIIGLMQMAVGSTIFFRTDSQVSALSTQLQQNPTAMRVEESARMEAVMKNFSIYKAIEMILLITGVGIIIFLQQKDVAAGIGIGLILQSAITLTLDIFAEARSADYMSALDRVPI